MERARACGRLDNEAAVPRANQATYAWSCTLAEKLIDALQAARRSSAARRSTAAHAGRAQLRTAQRRGAPLLGPLILRSSSKFHVRHTFNYSVAIRHIVLTLEALSLFRSQNLASSCARQSSRFVHRCRYLVKWECGPPRCSRSRRSPRPRPGASRCASAPTAPSSWSSE